MNPQEEIMTVAELRKIVKAEYSSTLVLPSDDELKDCINLLAGLATLQYKLSKREPPKMRCGE